MQELIYIEEQKFFACRDKYKIVHNIKMEGQKQTQKYC